MSSAERGQTSACEHVVDCEEVINVVVWIAERRETRNQVGIDGEPGVTGAYTRLRPKPNIAAQFAAHLKMKTLPFGPIEK